MRQLLLVFLTLVVFFIPSAPISAQADSNTPEVTTLNSGETVNKDYFAFNERVEIFGTVHGDVYAAGGQVLIEGRVNGDLLVAGGQVTISGEVTQDVRVAGGQVTISGEVGRNLTVGGGNVELTNSAQVKGSLLAGSGNLNIAAPIGKDVKIGGGQVTISSAIAGDVEAGVGSLRLTPNARVKGNLTYWSKEDVSVADGAVVSGEVSKNIVESDVSKEKFLGVLTGFALFLKLLSLFTVLLVGLFLIKFFPIFQENVTSKLRNKPWQSLGIGALTLFLTPLLAMVLFVTILGIPLAIIILILYGIALFLSNVFVIYLLGQLLMERFGNKERQIITLLVGIVVYCIISLLPIFGGVISFLATLLGLGALLITKRDTYLSAREKKVV